MEGDGIEFLVEDNGCGMLEEMLVWLFELFFMMCVEGIGLGLVIVCGVVCVYGGGIEVSFSFGQGMCFFMCLQCVVVNIE